MGDLQLWIYIIVGIIYFIAKMRKKPAEAAEQVPPRKDSRAEKPLQTGQRGEAQKQLTFEELLREITEGKTERQPEPLPQTQKRYVNYDEDLEAEEAQDLEDENYDPQKKDKVYAAYEEAKRQAFLRPSLEETMRLEDTDIKFGKFKAFEKEKERNLMEEYLGDLKDPQGLKKAFVMSEILNRKF